MSAAERWRRMLSDWAIPPHIREAAVEPPDNYPVELFARRADLARNMRTPADLAALEALPPRGSVLDVGCGAGAASLPLSDRAGSITGVDPSEDMLDACMRRLGPTGADVTVIKETWENAEPLAPLVDVVVCHNLAYLVPDLHRLIRTLTAHARGRVVLEMTARHPLTWLNDVWTYFHGTDRPSRPTADDAADVLAEAGIDAQRSTWSSAAYGRMTYFDSRDHLIAWVRRRLCLAPQHDPEVAALLAGRIVQEVARFGFPQRDFVAFWWDVVAGATAVASDVGSADRRR